MPFIGNGMSWEIPGGIICIGGIPGGGIPRGLGIYGICMLGGLELLSSFC